MSTLTDAVGAGELRRRTGKPLSGSYTLPKLLWLARHEPEVVARTSSFLLPMDFLLLRLTGRAVTDHTLAGGTMAYRLDTFAWDTELLEAVGIAPSTLPEIVTSGSWSAPCCPPWPLRWG
nr:FGGY family carbohydrate kinase [Tessaracoccus coleopterorum]